MRRVFTVLLLGIVPAIVHAAILMNSSGQSPAADGNGRSKMKSVMAQEKFRQSVAAERLALSLKNKQAIRTIKWPAQERPFYALLLELHLTRQVVDFISGSQIFLKRYPHSPFADNVLYLRGMIHFGLKNYGEAIRDFERVERYYPKSNKNVSSLFAKGMAYKKLNIKESAIDVFKRISATYPGSPEQFRAGNEMRLLQAAKKKVRAQENEAAKSIN